MLSTFSENFVQQRVSIVEFPYLHNLNTKVVLTSAKCSLGTKTFLKKLADKANEKEMGSTIGLTMSVSCMVRENKHFNI